MASHDMSEAEARQALQNAMKGKMFKNKHAAEEAEVTSVEASVAVVYTLKSLVQRFTRRDVKKKIKAPTEYKEHGFKSDKQTILLSQDSKDCGDCKDGLKKCKTCNGKGKQTKESKPNKQCPDCHGSEVNPCAACVQAAANPLDSKCGKCKGKGETKCGKCDGVGKLYTAHTEERERKVVSTTKFVTWKGDALDVNPVKKGMHLRTKPAVDVTVDGGATPSSVASELGSHADLAGRLTEAHEKKLKKSNAVRQQHIVYVVPIHQVHARYTKPPKPAKEGEGEPEPPKPKEFTYWVFGQDKNQTVQTKGYPSSCSVM